MMANEKYNVYYNDGVQYPFVVFTASTLEECKEWIKDDLCGRDEFGENDSEYLLNTSRTFYYEVYKDGDIAEYPNPLYSSDYYYID